MRGPRKLARRVALLALVALALGALGCPERPEPTAIADIMRERGLTEADVQAALRTYHPTGVHDEFLMFTSGGQGGNLIVIGVPSMRIMKYVGVFTPEPWQGYATGDQTTEMLAASTRHGKSQTWGDMHHMALSQTDGVYDGEVLFMNDKANARVALVDLSDFVTTQIVGSELMESNHGSAFVTPNTEYVIESSQYAAPLGGRYAPIEQYADEYRGAVIFWSYDREARRLDPEASWAIELPPYMQDLAAAGRGPSDGLVFINSINTELAWGGIQDGNPPLESGASQHDMDYLHIIDWHAAEEVVAAGRTERIADMDVIRLDTAIEEGLLHFVGAPKSPHGADITPDGAELVIGGKLDTHNTVYSVEQIRRLIEAGTYEDRDRYGVPILPFEQSIRGQVEIGLGPLHTTFDDQGFAYTSVYIESTVTKWSLEDLEVVHKLPVHYNIGHLTSVQGDTREPLGRYLVAMNKWSLDRFTPVGPLYPQNFQLIDISGDEMRLLYDMPLPLGEPHYAQIIPTDKLDPKSVYRPPGFDVVTQELSPNRVGDGEQRIERDEDGVHVYMTAIRSHFNPDIIRVREGDEVNIHLTSVEQADDAIHGFSIGTYNIQTSLEPGKHVDISFTADRPGVFPMYCTEFCSALHIEMAGYLLVEPAEEE